MSGTEETRQDEKTDGEQPNEADDQTETHVDGESTAVDSPDTEDQPETERYYAEIESELERARSIAERARTGSRDPSEAVEIPVAADMAARVEEVLGIDGVAKRVRELEADHTREEAALELAADFATGRVGEYETRAGKIEGAVRTAVALLTEGVVAAPIEGIDRVELVDNPDGSECVAIYYAGPIRSAGGTAQALSVLVADYVRARLGIDAYRPLEAEIGRYVEEVALYDDETGLQYSPKPTETAFIAEHVPIMLDGEATGDETVESHRNLQRVDTDSPRGGMCLVLAEGIALKAPKIQRYTRELDEVEWPWLDDLIEGTIGDGASAVDVESTEPAMEEGSHRRDPTDVRETAGPAGGGNEELPGPDDSDTLDRARSGETEGLAGPPRAEASGKFLRDLIAGRPVFAHPSEPGGFRLRYGRARNHGHATAGIHPATMHLVDDFLAPGTQLKTERPGKAAGVVPVDTIEGPTVRLADGTVRRIDDAEEALAVRNGVDQIIDLGEYLVNYGEFIENNQQLVPAGYAVEWWVQEFAAAGADVQALRDDPHIDLDDPAEKRAIEWAREYDAPLHPEFTYCWHDITVEEFDHLATAIAQGTVTDEGLRVEATDRLRDILERLLVAHRQGAESILIPHWRVLVRSVGADEELALTWDQLPEAANEWASGENAIRAANAVAPFSIRERAPTRVGTRMGRPEKSEKRELSPAVHCLFPLGDAGGDQRDVTAAADHADGMNEAIGRVETQVGTRECIDCGEHTWQSRCDDCGGHTEPHYRCPDCGRSLSPDGAQRVVCDHCDIEGTAVQTRTIDVRSAYREALDRVGERENAFDVLKGVKGLMSEHKTPEPIEKGILRAKHDVSAFKDGTVRYDMTDLPVTAVRPDELDVSVDRFRTLGYDTDVNGEPLRHADQLVQLKPQDVVLSDGAAEHMLSTAAFVDDLLEQYYDTDAYYELEDRDDLIGELVFGLAPHTSAAVVGRIVGFTSAAVGYAHPYFHAAKRRNCFHPSTKVWYRDAVGEWEYDRVDRLVEQRLEDPRSDDFGTRIQELDGAVHVPSITSAGDRVFRPVDAVSKHPAPTHLVRITTDRGRELTVTPDHELLHWSGTVERIPARCVEPGMSLPVPNELDIDGEHQRIDLVETLVTGDAIPNDDLLIRGLNSERLRALVAEQLTAENGSAGVTDRLDGRESSVGAWLDTGEIPVAALLGLLEADSLLDWLPADITLAVAGESVAMGRYLDIDEAVARLFGALAVEGTLTREAHSSPRITIHCTDESVRADITETVTTILPESAISCSGDAITVSSQLLTALVVNVLQMGDDGTARRIPPCLLGAPAAVLSAFLSAAIQCDETVPPEDGTERVRTTSDELKADLLGALRRVGATAAATRVPTSSQSGQLGAPDSTADAWEITITASRSDPARARQRWGPVRRPTDETPSTKRAEGSDQPLFSDGGNGVGVETVKTVEFVEAEVAHTYCLTVSGTHTMVANGVYTGQCDGDEDCVLLLMDGLLNFSEEYLPDKRGGRMDSPLVMSSRIDPTEIDDEAHNVDIVDQYPLELYEKSREFADPATVDVAIAGDQVGRDETTASFGHTHDTSDLAAGPDLSAYKTLGSMMEKMEAQLELARKLRAVDETDVAERVIESHFLPDLLGNLRAFASQETRCLDCNEKYRRPPLGGTCRNCGGDMTLTVHRGSVEKYMDVALRIADEYGADPYTIQRLKLLERALESLFEDDTNKQAGIADFM